MLCTPFNNFRAYSFGHLKSAKSPETVGFAEKNFSYRKNGNSENSRVDRLRREKCQKNTYSNTVGFFFFFIQYKNFTKRGTYDYWTTNY